MWKSTNLVLTFEILFFIWQLAPFGKELFIYSKSEHFLIDPNNGDYATFHDTERAFQNRLLHYANMSQCPLIVALQYCPTKQRRPYDLLSPIRYIFGHVGRDRRFTAKVCLSEMIYKTKVHYLSVGGPHGRAQRPIGCN